MSGYVRQSSADILPTAVIRATPVNNEFNALRDAFAQSGGHKHDGTAAEGDYVPLIADSSAKDKVVIDATNHRVGLFVNVAGTSTEQLRVQSGVLLPVTTNALDLGSSANKYKDLYSAGNAYLTTGSLTGQLTSTLASGTAPFVIASTTKVANLNVDLLDGNDWASPAAIGTTTAAAGTFTNLTANTSLTATTAAISAGTINNTVIGGTTAQAITGTLITATTGFVGGLTGAVTGNVTGNLTGNVTGNVTGSVTGNVTASTGSSSFNDVTINGTLNMNAGTSATITNLTSPTNTNDAATKGYVDTSISNLIASAPTTLDTLNEIATALGNDPNLSTTLTNSIATKLALAGGTMSGAIAMGTNKITGLGNPTANQDAATKTYVDTADALKLSLTGGTMSGAIAMGTAKITGLGDPTANQDAATKIYVDGILGSATSAATSAAAAATSASNAATSASNASTSASNASTSASTALTYLNTFKGQYYGSLSADPTLDPLGNAIGTGDLYWNSTSNEMRVYNGTAWVATYLPASGYMDLTTAQTAAGVKTFSSNPILSGGTANGVAYLNGSKVLTTGSALTFDGTNFATTGRTTANDFGSSAGAYYAFVGGTTYGSMIATAGTLTLNANNGSNLAFQIASSEQMRLTSTGLGIGTSSPSQKLEIAGTTSSTVAKIVSTTGANYNWYTNTGGSFYVGKENSAGSAFGAPAYSSVLYSDGAYPLVFFTNATSRMTLDSAGNLGLGVTPSAWSGYTALQVKDAALASSGSAEANLTANAFYGSLGWTYRQTAASARYALDSQHRWFTAASGTAGNAITFTQAMTLSASGGLSIGATSDAGAKNLLLDAGGKLAGNAPSGGTSSTIELYNASTGNMNLTAAYSAASITFATGGTTERARIDSSGNFGIGTISPAAKFDLIGDYKEGVITANTTTAYTISLSTGTFQILTLTGNCTFTFPTATSGKSFIILLKQDATGGRSVTWPAAVKWPGGTAPTITSTASKGDKFVFSADGTYWWGSNAGQNYL